MDKLDLIGHDLASLQDWLSKIRVYAVEGGVSPEEELKAKFAAEDWLARQLATLEPGGAA